MKDARSSEIRAYSVYHERDHSEVWRVFSVVDRRDERDDGFISEVDRVISEVDGFISEV